MSDLKVWKEMGVRGRLMHNEMEAYDLWRHIDAVELGWGVTISMDSRRGAGGESEARGVWTGKDRQD